MKIVYVYTTPDCPACDQLKKLLLAEKISFFERDVVEHEQAYVPIYLESGLDYVPVIEIRDTAPQVSTFLVPERDFKDVPSGVELAKTKLHH